MNFINSLSPARKKSILAVAILVVVALVIVVGLRLMGSSEADTTAAASGAQSVGPGQSGAPQSIAKTITPQSAGPANTTGSMGTDADPEQAQATDLSSVLTESALEEFDAKALEWTTEGLYSEGTPTIENPQVIEDDGAGNVTVSVCVDSSSVRILNDAGTVLTDDTAMTRALTYLRFVKDGQNWKLAGYSFPDDPTC